MESRNVWISLLLSALPAFSTLFLTGAAAAEVVHTASGLGFPANIEGRFTRGEIEEDGKRCSVTYAGKGGSAVNVGVHPAQKGATGPTRLDGDEHSAASAAFTAEVNKRVGLLAEGLKEATVVSQLRFQARPSNGPIGIKTTVRGKLEGKTTNREFLLFERNGFFVCVTTSYASEDWLKVGLIYTDVAHFLGWPQSQQSAQPNNSVREKGKSR